MSFIYNGKFSRSVSFIRHAPLLVFARFPFGTFVVTWRAPEEPALSKQSSKPEEIPNSLASSVARVASEEWWYFGCQYVDSDDSKAQIQIADEAHITKGDGSSPGFRERVWSYFRFGVFDGGDEWQNYTSWAWSGAFISHCFRQAGFADQFPYSPAHFRYVMEGVKNRADNLPGLKTYGTNESRPRVGDLLFKGRMETAGWSYPDLLKHYETGGGHFRSHCDIVVDIDEAAGHLFLIGGNVRNRVLRLKVNLDDAGHAVSNIYTALVSVQEI